MSATSSDRKTLRKFIFIRERLSEEFDRQTFEMIEMALSVQI